MNIQRFVIFVQACLIFFMLGNFLCKPVIFVMFCFFFGNFCGRGQGFLGVFSFLHFAQSNVLVFVLFQRQRNLSEERRKVLLDRQVKELVEFFTIKSVRDSELQGRTSGSLAWRLLRGETKQENEWQVRERYRKAFGFVHAWLKPLLVDTFSFNK